MMSKDITNGKGMASDISTAQAGQSYALGICSTRGVGLTVHEATLADVGVATDQECAGIGVNGWKPAHMLPHLLQVAQAGRLLLHDCAHATLQHDLCLSMPRTELLHRQEHVNSFTDLLDNCQAMHLSADGTCMQSAREVQWNCI